MSFIFDLVKNVFLRMLQIIWFGKRKISNSLSIYVKTNTGNTLAIDLDPKWDIRNVKEIVAPKMGISPDDIKIIFAGKELHNSTIIEVIALFFYCLTHFVSGVFCQFQAFSYRTATWVSRVSCMQFVHRRD